MEQTFDLTRFLKAQEDGYPIALDEMKSGRKVSHWMWYIFPQLKGLGQSHHATFYGILNVAEAKAYLEHPLLSKRLIEITQLVLDSNFQNIQNVLGSHIDCLKLKSSMTLFSIAASPNLDVFDRLLERYFNAEPDAKTIQMLDSSTLM